MAEAGSGGEVRKERSDIFLEMHSSDLDKYSLICNSSLLVLILLID